jgi:hypothetical protein
MNMDEPNAPGRPRAPMLLAYFFIALPEPISLPHGWISKFRSTDFSELADTGADSRDWLDLGPFERLTGSLAVHQLREEPRWASIDTATRAAASAFLWTPTDREDHGRRPSVTVTKTVLEVMIPVSGESESQLQDAFGKAVRHCEQLLKTYYMVTQHAVPFLTMARLPPSIPFAVRRAEDNEAHPRWPQRENLKLLMNPESDSFGLEPKVLSSAKLEAMSVAGMLPQRGPFASVLDVRREMALARRDGGTVPIAILCAASAEVLFRELLLMLLWEEGRSPDWTASEIRDRWISNIVRSEFHHRIGGNWSESGAVIAAWSSDIAELRNRVVHVGYVPTRPQIEIALKTYESVERFVGDRLAASLHRYPLTAMSFLGVPGTERRGVTRSLNRRLENDIHPADVSTSFERWRREVERFASDGPWTGDATRAAPMLVLYIDGREQWWLMDEHVGLCCVAQPPDMNDDQSTSVELLRTELRSTTDLPVHVALRAAGQALPLEQQPEWIPTGEAIPLNEYSRFPLSLLPPTTARRPD